MRDGQPKVSHDTRSVQSDQNVFRFDVSVSDARFALNNNGMNYESFYLLFHKNLSVA